MNVTKPPFDNLKVRQAVAYAIPYQKIMDAVLFGLAKPMFGAARRCADARWPGRSRTTTTPTSPRRRQLMAEAGYPNGFETTLSFDLGFAGVNEPLCVLMQESLAQIGIKYHDQQDARRQLAHRTQQEDAAALHQRLLRLARLSGVLLHLVLSRQEFDLQHDELPVEEMDGFIDGAVTAAATDDKTTYDKDVKGFVDTALRRHAAHPAVPAVCERRDAEERVRLRILVPPPARLPDAGERVARVPGCASAPEGGEFACLP